MSDNPLHAQYYADQASILRTRIVEQQWLARDTVRIRFLAPSIAAQSIPGQFVMLRLASCNDPLLARPLAVYDSSDDPQEGWVDLVYLVKGKFTQRLSKLPPGVPLDVWGPLGNGFATRPAGHLIMVAGGIGQTPFLTLAKQHRGLRSFGQPAASVAPSERITFLYGARSADYLAGLEDFSQTGIELRIATDDGSRGHQGFVTQLLEELLTEVKGLAPSPVAETADHANDGDPLRIACCGPEVMMEAVSQIAAAANVPCEVSLETPMACGIGICFTCVAKVKTADGEWDYKRTCVEGPIFSAQSLEW